MAPVVRAGAQDAEAFGALQLALGGVHGYLGVRGRQGKRHDKFQAYISCAGKKKTVPGLYDSAHEAAVALALFKQKRLLGLDHDAPAEKPRAKRGPKKSARPPCSMLCQQQPVAARLRLPSMPAPSPTPVAAMATPVTVAAVPLPLGTPAAAYGVPIVLAQRMPVLHACM